MGFVPAFGLGQGQEDFAFFAVPALGELPVYGGFGPLVRQVLPPAPDVRGRRGSLGGCYVLRWTA